MKRIPFTLIILIPALFSCSLPGPLAPTLTPVPTRTVRPQEMPVSGCISAEPTQKDIDRALSFADKVIDPAEWDRSYTVSENRVSVTWLNNPQGAVIYFEALIFSCGYNEQDLNTYFSGENWKTIFLNYQSYEYLEECKAKDDLRLYQFNAISQGFNYKIRYWVLSDTDMRVITTMIVFPVGSESLLDDYSSRLFPTLRSCS